MYLTMDDNTPVQPTGAVTATEKYGRGMTWFTACSNTYGQWSVDSSGEVEDLTAIIGNNNTDNNNK